MFSAGAGVFFPEPEFFLPEPEPEVKNPEFAQHYHNYKCTHAVGLHYVGLHNLPLSKSSYDSSQWAEGGTLIFSYLSRFLDTNKGWLLHHNTVVVDIQQWDTWNLLSALRSCLS